MVKNQLGKDFSKTRVVERSGTPGFMLSPALRAEAKLTFMNLLRVSR